MRNSRNRFVFTDAVQFVVPLEIVLSHNSENPCSPHFLAFRENLTSAIAMAVIPFTLTHTSLLDIRFQQILTRERILGLIPERPNSGLSKEGESKALEQAKAKMQTELDTPEIINRYAKDTLAQLDRHLGGVDFALAADELLRQVLVMIWNSFEILVNDSVRTLINSRPELGVKLTRDQKFQQHLSEKRIVSALSEFSFNISDCLGDIIFESLRLDTLPKIGEALRILGIGDQIGEGLKGKDLYLLNQQRNLIVHRRGIVDQLYIRSTGEKVPLGNRLALDSNYIERTLVGITEVGSKFIAGLSSLYSTGDKQA
jgi:hypothetical protein